MKTKRGKTGGIEPSIRNSDDNDKASQKISVSGSYDDAIYQQQEPDDEEYDDDDKAPDADDRRKLDDGFYEIEAVRRRRVRKGQLQYLIKWRGWPETANTWEPLENLQSCSDVIDAFEDSLQSGNHRHSLKRKRKYGGFHAPSKKNEQSSNITTCNITIAKFKHIDKPLPSLSLNYLNYADTPALQSLSESKEDINVEVLSPESAKQAIENSSRPGLAQKIKRKEIESYPKLSELKATVLTDEADTYKLSTCFQESKISEDDSLSNCLSMIDYLEPVPRNRCTGAKRRKSGSVKRFKKDFASCKTNVQQNSLPDITLGFHGKREQLEVENPCIIGDDSSCKKNNDESKNLLAINHIIEPISYSASISSSAQDVSVTFKALSSDGKEVMVDNKFLKANNPLLLINFYEQHLIYKPTL